MQPSTDETQQAGESTAGEATGSGTEETGPSQGTGDTTSVTQGPGKPDPGKPTNPPTNKVPEPERKLIGNTYTAGFPVVEKKEKLSIMTIAIPTFGDLQKNVFTKDFEKMTNVQIEWILVPEERIEERKVLALQSGNMPDVFSLYTTSIRPYERASYSKSGAFVDVSETIKTYGPNIQKAFEDVPEAKALCTDPDTGKIHSLPLLAETKVGHTLAINKTWLNKLGLKIPQTVEELYEVMVAFKNEDPNGNGVKDEIPFATFMINNGLFTPWGITAFVQPDKSGKLIYTPTTENQRQALLFWNKVYKEGLMDKSNLGDMSGDWLKYRQMISGGKVGIWQWQNVNDFSEGLLKQYVPFAWPTANLTNGPLKTKDILAGDPAGAGGFYITKSCKNIPMAVRVLDYFYTDDGYMYKTYGAPGKYYTKSGSNYQMKAFENGAERKDAPGWLLNGAGYLRNGKMLDAPGKTSVQKARDSFMADANKVYLDRIKEVGAKPILQVFTANEAQRLKKYQIFTDMHWLYLMRFVDGGLNISTGWNGFVQEMNAKGLADYMKIQQAAYDRAKNIK